jgi:afadin
LLLQLPKQDSTAISSHCFKLNSLQIRQLLELYQPERDEADISLELIEKAVSVAESTADELARSEGQNVILEEEPELHLPFLLPDDGYSSEKIRGVPPGLKEFLDPLITPGKMLYRTQFLHCQTLCLIHHFLLFIKVCAD